MNIERGVIDDSFQVVGVAFVIIDFSRSTVIFISSQHSYENLFLTVNGTRRLL